MVRKMKIATSLILAAHGLPEEDTHTEPPCWVLNSPHLCVCVCVCVCTRVGDRDQHYMVCLSLHQDTTVHLRGKVLKTPDVKMEIKNNRVL